MKIILHDGTEIKNLTLNASTLVSKTKPDKEKFENNMKTVRFVYDDGTEEVKKNCSLDTLANYGEGWFICISENPETAIPADIADKAAAYDILMGEETV